MAPAPVPIPEGLRVPEQAAVSQPCPPPAASPRAGQEVAGPPQERGCGVLGGVS